MPLKDPVLRKKYEQERYLANRAKIIENMQRWRKANPDKANLSRRRARLRKAYGLTIEQYENMLESQSGACAICQMKCKTGVRLAVDHNHKTGAIRGLLCWNCNTMLGKVEDSVDVLTSAINYLERSG